LGALPARMQEGCGTRRIAPNAAPSGGRQNENAQLRTVGRLDMVAWGGIEPPTRGFSIAALPKHPAFMRVASEKRVTCYRPCYEKTTQIPSTFSLYHPHQLLASTCGVRLKVVGVGERESAKNCAAFFGGSCPPFLAVCISNILQPAKEPFVHSLSSVFTVFLQPNYFSLKTPRFWADFALL